MVFLLIITFYYLKTANTRFSSTWRMLLALVLVLLSNLLIFFIHVADILHDGFILVAQIMMLVAFYYVFDYHDQYGLTEVRGITKIGMLFILGYLIGITTFPYLVSGEIVTLLSERNILVITIIYAFVSFFKTIYYLNFENKIIAKNFGEPILRYIRLFSVIFMLVITLASVYFFIQFEEIKTDTLLGYILSMFVFSLLALGYTMSPIRNIVFPTRLVWLGVIDNVGNVTYSITLNPSAATKLDDGQIREKIETSYASLNFLFSEALTRDLQIQGFRGSLYSFIQEPINDGLLIAMVEESNLSVASYNYHTLLRHLSTDDGLFSSSKLSGKSKEEMDQLLLGLLQEGF